MTQICSKCGSDKAKIKPQIITVKGEARLQIKLVCTESEHYMKFLRHTPELLETINAHMPVIDVE